MKDVAAMEAAAAGMVTPVTGRRVLPTGLTAPAFWMPLRVSVCGPVTGIAVRSCCDPVFPIASLKRSSRSHFPWI
jgi:hypothetical protein